MYIHLEMENEHKLGSIGKAGCNLEVLVVDETGRGVSPGEVSEIVVRRNGVMREY